MEVLAIIGIIFLTIGYTLGGILFAALAYWGDTMDWKDWIAVIFWPVTLILLATNILK